MTRLLPGDAGEIAWCAEQERLGMTTWRTGGTAGVKELPGGRRIPIRLGQDILGAFDTLGLSPAGLWLSQVKSGREYEGPSRAWLDRLAALPDAPWLTYLWVYWSGWQDWRVTRLWPDGRAAVVVWPPQARGAA